MSLLRKAPVVGRKEDYKKEVAVLWKVVMIMNEGTMSLCVLKAHKLQSQGC